MDLGSILNADDRSRMPNQTYTRSLHSGHRGGNTSGQNAGRPLASSIKTSPIYSPVYTAQALKVIDNLEEPSWPPEGTSLLRSVPGSISSNEKVPVSRRPRINTSTLSLSVPVNRRASVNSPASLSSSSLSPPSPPTPSSTASIGRTFGSLSYGRENQHKQKSGFVTRNIGPLKHLPEVSHANQTQINPSMIPSIAPTNQANNQLQLHLNRTLPLPVTRGPAPLSTLLSNPIRQPIPPIPYPTLSSKQQQKQPRVNSSNQKSQRICSAIPNCTYSTPKRRVVSQFFGRNKKETRMIPRHCWIYHCRQHYQRFRYRLKPARFAEMQMKLVRGTITALESENIVTSWEVKLRKRAFEKLSKSGNSKLTYPSSASSSTSFSSPSHSQAAAADAADACASGGGKVAGEKLLLPYYGAGKSFKQVYDVLNLVDEICRRDDSGPPEFEVLPSFTAEWVRAEENRRKMSRVDGTDSESDDDEGKDPGFAASEDLPKHKGFG